MAFTKYFIDIINKDWYQDKILKFQNDEICLQHNKNYNMPLCIDIINNLDDMAIIKINSLISENDQINQLHKFIFHAIKIIN